MEKHFFDIENPRRYKREIVRFSLLIFAVVGVILSIFIVARKQMDIEHHISYIQGKSSSNLATLKERVEHHLNMIETDLLFLPRLNEVIRLSEYNDRSEIDHINSEFLAFIRTKEFYDQIRLLDTSGMEVCRVNFNNGFPGVTPADGLQDKGDRYYFQESINLRRDEVYVSPFDLNKENGQIEQPLKPMIRFATPIFDSSEQKCGVVLLNYFGEKLIQLIEEDDKKNSSHYFLLNSDGYWLYSSNSDDEWGFMYPAKVNFTFRERHPELWSQISSNRSTQIVNDSILLTSVTIEPIRMATNTASLHWYLVSMETIDEIIEVNTTLHSNIKIYHLAYYLFALIVSIFSARMVVHRNMYKEALEHAALFDSLTGLPNRLLFMDRFYQLSEETRRYKKEFAICFIDLDGFKAVNDSVGHEAGDEVLRKVASRFRKVLRKSDTVARFGGDEFLILLSHIDMEESIDKVCNKLISEASRKISVSHEEVTVGASIGVVIVTDALLEEESVDDIITEADKAMYSVKVEGKNNYKIFSGETF